MLWLIQRKFVHVFIIKFIVLVQEGIDVVANGLDMLQMLLWAEVNIPYTSNWLFTLSPINILPDKIINPVTNIYTHYSDEYRDILSAIVLKLSGSAWCYFTCFASKICLLFLSSQVKCESYSAASPCPTWNKGLSLVQPWLSRFVRPLPCAIFPQIKLQQIRH